MLNLLALRLKIAKQQAADEQQTAQEQVPEVSNSNYVVARFVHDTFLYSTASRVNGSCTNVKNIGGDSTILG